MKHLLVTAPSEESSAKCITEADVRLGANASKAQSQAGRDWGRPHPHQLFPKSIVLGLLSLLHRPDEPSNRLTTLGLKGAQEAPLGLDGKLEVKAAIC